MRQPIRLEAKSSAMKVARSALGFYSFFCAIMFGCRCRQTPLDNFVFSSDLAQCPFPFCSVSLCVGAKVLPVSSPTRDRRVCCRLHYSLEGRQRNALIPFRRFDIFVAWPLCSRQRGILLPRRELRLKVDPPLRAPLGVSVCGLQSHFVGRLQLC